MTGWLYPALPGSKEGELPVGTSEDAAAAMAPEAATLRDRALAELRRAGLGGLTADECAARLDRSVLAIRPRISELGRRGLAEKSGLRRRNDSGRDAAVWLAVESVE